MTFIYLKLKMVITFYTKYSKVINYELFRYPWYFKCLNNDKLDLHNINQPY